jgi:phospholipase A1/A2
MKVLFSIASVMLVLLFSNTRAADAINTNVIQPAESLSGQFTPTDEELCWIRQLQMASDQTTTAQIVELCHQESQQQLQDASQQKNVQQGASQPDNSNLPKFDENTPATQTELKTTSLLVDRLTRESFADNNPHAITSHKLNYLLPISYVEGLNATPFESAGENSDFDNMEAKFQFSIKAALAKSLLFKNDKLYFAFTTLSFWQVYDRDNSAPFREINYEPEIYWQIPFQVTLFSRDVYVAGLGISHQSNGQPLPLSRSWNRIFTNFTWENGDWVFQLKPWWRIPESEQQNPSDAQGDDNPDIEKYLGYFEFMTLMKDHRHEVALILRNNLQQNNKGAVQLDWSFPIHDRFRGYIQGFNGYGESLIDYNRNVSRIGFGIILSEWL